jgi:hypothetical protein
MVFEVSKSMVKEDSWDHVCRKTPKMSFNEADGIRNRALKGKA